MGGGPNLLWDLGEYQRGYRVLAAFSSSGKPEDIGASLRPNERFHLINDLAIYAARLGQIDEAWAIRQATKDSWESEGNEGKVTVLGQTSILAYLRGRLPEAYALAEATVEVAGRARPVEVEGSPLDAAVATNGQQFAPFTQRAITQHAFGNIAAARADFRWATEKEGGRLVAQLGSGYARHLADLGNLPGARQVCDDGLQSIGSTKYEQDMPRFRAILARIDLMEGTDPTPHLLEVRAWTSRTGEVRYIIEAHLLSAFHLLKTGDLQSARGEAEAGLLHAVSCGYGLLRIELLVVLSRIRLAWPDPPRAIQAAREALDLASHPDCQYAWGQADAAQAWGEAYFANHEPTLSARAFTRALEVRKRIEHPGVAETEKWLARVGGPLDLEARGTTG
jgi:tetratricopeptide (TPR) repeat protein